MVLLLYYYAEFGEIRFSGQSHRKMIYGFRWKMINIQISPKIAITRSRFWVKLFITDDYTELSLKYREPFR